MAKISSTRLYDSIHGRIVKNSKKFKPIAQSTTFINENKLQVNSSQIGAGLTIPRSTLSQTVTFKEPPTESDLATDTNLNKSKLTDGLTTETIQKLSKLQLEYRYI